MPANKFGSGCHVSMLLAAACMSLQRDGLLFPPAKIYAFAIADLYSNTGRT